MIQREEINPVINEPANTEEPQIESTKNDRIFDGAEKEEVKRERLHLSFFFYQTAVALILATAFLLLHFLDSGIYRQVSAYLTPCLEQRVDFQSDGEQLTQAMTNLLGTLELSPSEETNTSQPVVESEG